MHLEAKARRKMQYLPIKHSLDFIVDASFLSGEVEIAADLVFWIRQMNDEETNEG